MAFTTSRIGWNDTMGAWLGSGSISPSNRNATSCVSMYFSACFCRPKRRNSSAGTGERTSGSTGTRFASSSARDSNMRSTRSGRSVRSSMPSTAMGNDRGSAVHRFSPPAGDSVVIFGARARLRATAKMDSSWCESTGSRNGGNDGRTSGGSSTESVHAK